MCLFLHEEVGIGILSLKLYLFHCFSQGYLVGFMSFRLRPDFTGTQLACKLELPVLNCTQLRKGCYIYFLIFNVLVQAPIRNEKLVSLKRVDMT